jgi:ubiquitin carboxyl-terminal hydrolase 7
MRHDVQEFNRILKDKLETKMKVCGYPSLAELTVSADCFAQGTTAEGTTNHLFVGKMKNYIKCVNVEYVSSRTEEFFGQK